MILPQFFLVFRELEIATINYILSNTVVLTEINEAIQVMSIEGYCVCRDRYAAFRKLPQSRKLYLSMYSASRIFFSASFLSVYKVVRTAKKQTICVVGLFTSHTNIELQMSVKKNYAN